MLTRCKNCVVAGRVAVTSSLRLVIMVDYTALLSRTSISQ